MNEASDDDELKVSVCSDCARHPSLKNMIEADLVTGVCAFCCKTDAQVRNPENIEPMIMLMRALIRFYWDEVSYNSHFGGDDAPHLFDDADNPVVKPFASDEYYDEFYYLLLDPPYPEWDKGVSIYAGFYEETRMMNFAISRSTPHHIRTLRERLSILNFEIVKPELEMLIKPFIADLKFVLPKDGIWFRARTGIEARFMRHLGFDSHVVRMPYMHASIGASPTPGNGRLNREAVPVLYLGSNPDTALAEIRPHPGHYVSIGGFKILQDLNVADFNPDISLFSMSDERLAMYWIIQAFDRWMSTPVTPDDKVSYLITQLLAEILQAQGFHAVQFRSSVSDGVNLCVFDTTHAAFVEGHSSVRFVQNVKYDAPERPFVTNHEPGDYLLDR